MTIKEALEYGISLLRKNKIEEPILKTKILLAKALDKNKEHLLINETQELEEKTINIYKKFIDEICNFKPLQYIIKNQEFMGLNFYVDENVLIPQPDTETLVEEVLNIAKAHQGLKILDLCTGSGAIAVSLKRYLKDAKITATDISKEALGVARQNAKNNNTEIKFIKSDLFNNIDEKYNVIVSNPPYIKTNIIKTLDKEVQKEPVLALDGGQDGLDFYKKIISRGYKFLEKNGYLCLEIGYDQKNEVIKLINENGHYKELYSKKDLAGNDRVIICRIR